MKTLITVLLLVAATTFGQRPNLMGPHSGFGSTGRSEQWFEVKPTPSVILTKAGSYQKVKGLYACSDRETIRVDMESESKKVKMDDLPPNIKAMCLAVLPKPNTTSK